MKTVYLLVFLLCSSAFAGAIIKKGYGKAPVGANQTESEVEEFALLRAQSDAMNKIGSYVESNLQVAKTESAGNSTEQTSHSLSRLAVGLIKMVDGSKKMRKTLDPSTEVTIIEVKADFQIEEEDFNKAVDAVVARKQGSDAVQLQIEQFSKAEKDLVEIDQSESIQNSKAAKILEEYKIAQRNVTAGIFKLNGGLILGNLKNERDERKVGIQSYLKNIADLGGPTAIFNRVLKNPLENIS